MHAYVDFGTSLNALNFVPFSFEIDVTFVRFL